MKPEDRAQELELSEWEARQERAIMPMATMPSAMYCVDPHCGEAIPEARRNAWPGVQFCVVCQALNEQRKGRYAGAN